MSRHHERVRAVLLVHGLETERRSGSGDSGDPPTVVDLTARVTRVQAELDKVRSHGPGRRSGDGQGTVDTGTDTDTWLLAVYDAALVELCAALGVGHGLVHDGVCPESERQRVELELLSQVLPLG